RPLHWSAHYSITSIHPLDSGLFPSGRCGTQKWGGPPGPRPAPWLARRDRGVARGPRGPPHFMCNASTVADPEPNGSDFVVPQVTTFIAGSVFTKLSPFVYLRLSNPNHAGGAKGATRERYVDSFAVVGTGT